MRRFGTTAAAAMAGLALAAAGARADGLPVEGVDAGGSGVETAAAADRYVTLKAGRDTVVARVRRDGGAVLRSRLLRGRFAIPAVALDGSASGLSGDGRTLVVIRPRVSFPRERTTLAVLDAVTLKLRSRLVLRGDFSFDALSPDGASMYLIQYLSRRDPTRYAVRLYHLGDRRFASAPIVDPSEPDERMAGWPITRIADAGGRWHHTLYDGADGEPFIHALDSVRAEALCIDLPGLRSVANLYDLRLRLRPDGDIAVVGNGVPVALVDSVTHRVRGPATRRAAEAGGTSAWVVGGAALFLLLLGGASWRALRATRGGPTPVDLEAIPTRDETEPEEIPARVRVP
jgi:hypothetical protein